jgi:hypothetical protein
MEPIKNLVGARMKDNADYQVTKALINIAKKKHITGIPKEHISAAG